MFETVHLHARLSLDGRLHLDLPIDLPPESEVHVTVSEPPASDRTAWGAREVPATTPIGPKRRFATREEWEAHARSVIGSIPDIERPDQGTLREIEPL